LGTLEAQYREALTADETATRWTGEGAALGRLATRAKLGRALTAVAAGELLEGPERELQTERGLSGHTLPWDLFAPSSRRAVQHRADRPTTVPASAAGAHQNMILARVFGASSAMWLGVELPMVGVGESVYPVLTQGAAGAVANPGAAVDATAATFSAAAIKPTRLTARYLWRIEDAALLMGLEDALRRDLVAALSDAMDRQVLVGDGTAPNVTGLTAALTAPPDPTNEITYSDALALWYDQVDGRYAMSSAGVRIAMAPDAYSILGQKFEANGAAMGSVLDWAEARGVLRVTHQLPGARSSVSTAIASRVGGVADVTEAGAIDEVTFTQATTRAAVAPVWEGVRMIRDEVTGAARGEVALTATMLFGFAVVRADEYALVKIRLA